MRFLAWRPSHGPRQFVREVAIIGLGVLLALGLEQLIVSSNERRSAAEARQVIRHEIGSNLGILSNRFRTRTCIKNRLAEIEMFIDAASSGSVDSPPRWIGRPQVWNMDAYRWQAASDAGRASLFSLKEQSAFSDIYGSFRSIHDAQQLEQVLWAQLRSLEGQSQLSETAASTMRSILSQARYVDWRIRIGYAQSSENANQEGIPAIPHPTLRGSNSVCIPIGTPRDIAIRQTGSNYGEP